MGQLIGPRVCEALPVKSTTSQSLAMHLDAYLERLIVETVSVDSVLCPKDSNGTS